MACNQLVNKRRQGLRISGVGVTPTVPTAADPCSVGWVAATDILLYEWAFNDDFDGAGTLYVWTRNTGGIVQVYPSAGGGGTPGTPVNSVQFNNPLGTFDGDSTFTYQTSGGLALTNEILAQFTHSTTKVGKIMLNDNVIGIGAKGVGFQYGDDWSFVMGDAGIELAQMNYNPSGGTANYVRVTATQCIAEVDNTAVNAAELVACIVDKDQYAINKAGGVALFIVDRVNDEVQFGGGATSWRVAMARGSVGQILMQTGAGGLTEFQDPSFADDIFAIVDNADDTRKAVFEASGISAATTRTFTFPDQSGTVALTSDFSNIDQIDMFIEAPSVKVYVLRLFCKRAGTINDLTHKIGGGTSMTVDIEIDGTNVTGLAGLTVNTGESTNTASALNTFSVGDTIQLNVTAVTGSPTDAQLSLKITYD